MDIKIEKKKYLVPRKYWAWIGGGAVLVAVLVWLGLSNFSSTLKVDRKGLSIGNVEKAQWRTRQTLWGGSADANPKLLPNDT